MATVTICSDFGAQENKVCHCFHCFPIYLPKSDGTRCYDLSFWILSFKSAFSLSFFAFIKMLFSSSSLSAIRVVSSAYLSLLIFLFFSSIYYISNPAFLQLQFHCLSSDTQNLLSELLKKFSTDIFTYVVIYL